MNVLERMKGYSVQRVKRAQQDLTLDALKNTIESLPLPPVLGLDSSGMDIIAEIKVKTPDFPDGFLPDADIKDYSLRSQSYIGGGVAAISIHTEPSLYGGTLRHLSVIADRAAVLDTPCLRRDFIVDPYQIYEARAHGAAGIFLITRLVDTDTLKVLLNTVAELKMFCVLENYDQGDLKLAMEALDGADNPTNFVILGMSARIPGSGETETHHLSDLIEAAPDGYRCMAEAGIHSLGDITRIVQMGYRLALVSRSVMQTKEPRKWLNAMLHSGRRAVLREEKFTSKKQNL